MNVSSGRSVVSPAHHEATKQGVSFWVRNSELEVPGDLADSGFTSYRACVDDRQDRPVHSCSRTITGW